MADIFISYARADRDKIEPLSQALEGLGYSVWWDRHIQSGAEFSKHIEQEIENAKTVVAAWSQSANESRWVKDEANAAAESGKLLAISLDGSHPPIGFRQFHYVDFQTWNEEDDAPVFKELANAINERITGVKAEVSHTTRAPTVAASNRNYIFAGIALALVLLAGMLFWPQSSDESQAAVQDVVTAQESEMATPAPFTTASIAVLPFADLSAANDQEYFSDGIAEEILNVLARVDGLKVASRTSSFRYKDADLSIPDIARSLNVAHVLEGSVRKAGDQVRITAQLIKAGSDEHLWSQTFDRTLTVENIFAIQDEISRAIVEAIGVNINLGDVDSLKFAAAAGTSDLRAYDAFLKGREMFIWRDDFMANDILAKLEEVVTLDPNFARGWSALAAAYAVQESWRNFDRDYNALALDAANKALQLDPDLAEPHSVIGMVSKLQDGRPDKVTAIDQLTRAIQLDPNNALSYSWRGQHLTELGFFDDAERDLKRALEFDQDDLVSSAWWFKTDLYQGEVDTATDRMPAPMANNHFTNMHMLIAGIAYGNIDARIEKFQNSGGGTAFTEEEKAALFDVLTNDDIDADSAYNRFETATPPEYRGALRRPIWLYAFKQFEDIKDLPDLVGDAVWWLRTHEDYLTSPERYRLMNEQGLPDYWRARGYPPQCREMTPLPDGRDYECT